MDYYQAGKSRKKHEYVLKAPVTPALPLLCKVLPEKVKEQKQKKKTSDEASRGDGHLSYGKCISIQGGKKRVHD